MLSRTEARSQLLLLAQGKPATFELFLRTMAVVTAACQAEGYHPVIVGGHAVSIYTRGDYATRDIDLVAPDSIAGILADLGFSRGREDRHWYHDELNLALEVPSCHLAGDSGRVVKLNLDGGGAVFLIGVEDLILDRLRACVYWKSTVDCEWAGRLFAVHHQDIDLDYLLRAMEREPEGEHMRRRVEAWRLMVGDYGA
ncbi:MAG TPA: hypothetical protein DCM14_07405 [Clostridiales bacterium UBA8153]|nr:hypothetical protein [Clostridiales bacterium UBA8153]